MIEQQNLYVNTGEFEKVCPFPIGYIYLSTSSTSPATLYGGTWTALTDSKFLRPSGSWNTIGGSEKITQSQMPAHRHRGRAGFSYMLITASTSISQSKAWSSTDNDTYSLYWRTSGVNVLDSQYCENTGGVPITGSLIALATLGIEQLSLYPLDGGER